MADPHIRAAFYLSPTLDLLWRWAADGEVLVWSNDATIAFKAEVETVLRRLAPGGLPPFGAVVLLLAACREGWMASIGRETIVGYAAVFGNMRVDQASHPVRTVGKAFHNLARDITGLVQQLDAVSRLPREQIEGVDAKALLAEVAFEEATNRSSPEDAAIVIQAFDDGISPDILRPQLSHEESVAQFAKQVDGLTQGLQNVSSEVLQRRAKTGLGQAINPAEEVSPSEAARRLLAEFRADTELAGLAKLALDLMAAVSVPRSLREREDLSVGGVSDLSNRGTLDRLIISELAHDDLTLAVRVAMNEALYLRRESPPREPPHRRAILVDAGIRMWGTPRVFATAVAMALTATSDPKAGLAAARATRAGIEPINLTTRDGVESHLGALETSPHPGKSLDAFFAAASAEDAGHTDLMLVTHADALADPDFVAELAATRHPPMYIAALDREGGFSLLAVTKTGRTIIRQATLSLDSILNDGAAKKSAGRGVPLINKAIDRSLPAILYADPFPFLLPHNANPRRSATSTKHGLVAATRDGRLLHWRDEKHGARQLTALLPRGHVGSITIDDSTDSASVLILRKADTDASLVTADLDTGRCMINEIKLPQAGPIATCVYNGTIFVIYRDGIHAYALTEGQFLAKLSIPPSIKWYRERFFRDGTGCLAVSYDGTPTLKLDRIPRIARRAIPFDRVGHDGPLAYVPGRDIIGPSGTNFAVFKTPQPSGLRGISKDGRLLAFASTTQQWILDLDKDGEHRLFTGSIAERLLAPQIYWSTLGPHSRTTFKGILLAPPYHLSLCTTKNVLFSMRLTSIDELSLTTNGRNVDVSQSMRLFSPPRYIPGTRISIATATWDDGSKAFLDSRGIFHLRSSDRAVPELSFTLTNLDCAAWSSDGNLAGPDYIVGTQRTVPPQSLLKCLMEFVARLR